MSILPYFCLEGGEEGVDLAVVGDVALEAGGAGELVDEALGLELHALVLIADGQGCAGLVEFLGDAPGDGTLVGQPEDHGRLTRQIDHACFRSSMARVGVGMTGPANRISAEDRAVHSGQGQGMDIQPPRSTSSTLPAGRPRKRGAEALEFFHGVGGEAADDCAVGRRSSGRHAAEVRPMRSGRRPRRRIRRSR